jgi:hypothetical protein
MFDSSFNKLLFLILGLVEAHDQGHTKLFEDWHIVIINKPNKLNYYISFFEAMTENQTLAFDLSRTFYSHQTRQEIALDISIDHSKKVLQDKDNEMNKAIPIKEYSNKFLRSMTYKPRAEPPSRRLNTQQRFNVILKKKNVLTKNLPK